MLTVQLENALPGTITGNRQPPWRTRGAEFDTDAKSIAKLKKVAEGSFEN